MGLMLSACSDFLDRKPLTQPDNTTFLSGREQVENYINALYPLRHSMEWVSGEKR